MSKSYVALIADAIASRDLAPATRARLQTDVRAAVKDLNQRYRRVLAARFAVTLGDELQGLLATPQPVWDLAHDVRARLPTVDWVVACGRGPITTPLAPTSPAAWPGPSWPPGIRCFGHSWRRNPRESAVRRAAARLYAGRHALARPGGRPPPRPGAALRGGAVRDRGPRPGHVPRPARAAERRWTLVGAGGTPGHRLPLCLGTGIVLIRSVLELPTLQMRRDEDRTAGAIDVARGRAVGSLERALALTLVLLGDYAAVGWIIAAKSLARFKQLEDREFAEYFLVGTLASFLLAVLVGVGIRILLKQA